MKILSKIALGLIAASGLMFIIGASLFSYSGERLHPIISDIGMYSFMLWLPTFLLGGLLLIVTRIARRNN